MYLGFYTLKREKVSVWKLLDDFGTAYGPFLLVGETVVSRQPAKNLSIDSFFSLKPTEISCAR